MGFNPNDDDADGIYDIYLTLRTPGDYGVNYPSSEGGSYITIDNDFINESRYAESFCRGKFKIKKWGRIKIIYELKKKKISQDNINKGIRIIDENEYKKLLESLYIRKIKSIKIKDRFTKKAKIFKFLQQKGFETNMIWELINNDN